MVISCLLPWGLAGPLGLHGSGEGHPLTAAPCRWLVGQLTGLLSSGLFCSPEESARSLQESEWVALED